jgi:hypothetical protein
MHLNRLMPQLAIGATILPSISLFLFIQGSSPLLIQDCAQAAGCESIQVAEGSRAPTHAVQSLQPQFSEAPEGAHCMAPKSNVCANPGQACAGRGYICTTMWMKSARYSKTEVPLEKVPLEKATLDLCMCQCVSKRLLGLRPIIN